MVNICGKLFGEKTALLFQRYVADTITWRTDGPSARPADSPTDEPLYLQNNIRLFSTDQSRFDIRITKMFWLFQECVFAIDCKLADFASLTLNIISFRKCHSPFSSIVSNASCTILTVIIFVHSCMWIGRCLLVKLYNAARTQSTS